jgi:hypothetical protein
MNAMEKAGAAFIVLMVLAVVALPAVGPVVELGLVAGRKAPRRRLDVSGEP